MLNANELEIDYQRSFFCGDAAGRGAKKGKKKDYGEVAFPSICPPFLYSLVVLRRIVTDMRCWRFLLD